MAELARCLPAVRAPRAQVWLTAGAALLVHCYFAYRNYERENHALLRRMEAELGSTRAALLESLAGMQARLDAQHAALRRELLADVDGLLLNHPALSPNAARLGAPPRALSPRAPDFAALPRQSVVFFHHGLAPRQSNKLLS